MVKGRPFSFVIYLLSVRFTRRPPLAIGPLPVRGAVAEWSKAHAWKVCMGQKLIEGSNPSRSANISLQTNEMGLTGPKNTQLPRGFARGR